MNYSFGGAGENGLTFSSSGNNKDIAKNSSIRMAGEIFQENGDLNNSNNNSASNAVPDSRSGTSGNTSPPLWSNQYSEPASQPQSSKQVDSKGALPEQTTSSPKTPATSSPQAPVTYDEDQYRYYKSDFGSGTGAEAYAADMESYNNQPDSIKGMPHVHAMFHPDWGRSQRAGGGAEAPEAQDYATMPKFAAGSKQQAVFERDFGPSDNPHPKSHLSEFK